MFEFLGVLFIILIIYLWVTADDLDFTFKLDGKNYIDYHKHKIDDDEEEEDIEVLDIDED